MSQHVTVIGTIFVDCKGFAQHAYQPDGRNLGHIQFVHGGVGRNVAENLARLELNVRFISTSDTSGLGQEVVERLAKVGVHTEDIRLIEKSGMGMWLAVLDENGNLAGSISQMPNLEALQAHLLNVGERLVREADHLVLELDLNEDITHFILDHAQRLNKPVYGIPGNLSVILSDPSILKQVDCFILNEFEAAKLLSVEELHTLSPEDVLTHLKAFIHDHQYNTMVVTLGANGSVYYNPHSGEAGVQPALPVQLVDTSGAGDAFFSGTVMGLSRGLSLGDAVLCGTKVAGWTIESRENNCTTLKEKFEADEQIQRLLSVSVVG